MDKIKIGCLTYKKLDELTRNAILNLNDSEIEPIILEGLMDVLTEKVKQAIKDGVEVFIGGGANAEIITKSTEAPVLKIKLSAMDYIESLNKAKQYGENIAIVNFHNAPIPNILRLQKLLNINVELITFKEPEELEEKIKNSNAEVIIGGGLAFEVAGKCGLLGILNYPGEDTIIDSIKEAKEMAIALRREKEKSKINQAIINFNPSGIIATDAKGYIKIFNPAAEEIFNISSSHAIAKPLYEVIPNCYLDKVLKTGEPELGVIQKVNDSEIVVNRVPIENENKLIGAVATVQKVSEIQITEQKIRLLNVKKGFTAKYNFSDILGTSKKIKQEIEKAKKYAKNNSSILIYGETGVGKEIFAQSIHNYSLRQAGPFVAINCAALPENLLESELFGYDEGAFTGSRKGGKAGLFELAHQGTIFLDEIGELSPNLQARLLRVLQEKEVMRIGGDRVIPVNVRIIAATNKNLEDKVATDFREDLFYRLNVLQINIPPLRRREGDILKIFLHFLNKYPYFDFKNFSDFPSFEILKIYSWPGNVRELQNVVERFSIHIQSSVNISNGIIHNALVEAIGEDRLLKNLLKQYNLDDISKIKGKEVSIDFFKKMLIIFPGGKNKIAEKLGMSRTTLWRLLKEKSLE